MDRRQSPRQPVDEVVLLTSLTLAPHAQAPAPCPVRIVERSAYGLKIETVAPIAPSTLVRLDSADSLLLGEVAWCAKVNDQYQIGLKIEESLQHVGDLSKLVASLFGGDAKRPLHQSEPVEAR
ncbi:MAG TPA: hypothetical protein VGK29_04730 [Paludibaculum sp.]